MKEIIIINGTGGSGKDTFVTYCSEHIKTVNISSVDKVKEAANILVGWNGEKDEKSRKLLVDLKRLSIEYNDSPSNYIVKKAKEFEESDNELMFIHIREIAEIKKIKNIINAKTLLVKNPKVKLILSNESDANVNNYEYDYVLLNNGTLVDLQKKARDFVKKIGNNNE